MPIHLSLRSDAIEIFQYIVIIGSEKDLMPIQDQAVI